MDESEQIIQAIGKVLMPGVETTLAERGAQPVAFVDKAMVEAMLKLIRILKYDGSLQHETRYDLRKLEEELEK